MAYRIRAGDRASFKQCRRAWDLGARNRQNYEPVEGPRAVDLDRALRDALAVYYFPGMWEWDRAIVQPLVHRALDKSLRAQQEAGADEQACRAALTRGHPLLDAYARWAPTADRFTPVQVEVDFEVEIPDPATPGTNLTTPPGGAIRYVDRVDLLVVDEHDAYWAVQHRLVTEEWAEEDTLLLDERTIAWCWAWPLFYLDMQVTGTVYNEVKAHAADLAVERPAEIPAHQRMLHRRMYATAADVPRERVRTEGTGAFRRTRIPRGAAELDAAGRHLAEEARTATTPGLAVYPSPAPQLCASCAYRSPCLVMNEGRDPAEVLAASYRHRPPERIEEGRLGGATWSMSRGAAPPPWVRRPPDEGTAR